ncbi:hypothetical protein M422DRAFT_265601 [Sphaerobolus stellatus SS14]|uniref:Uncharacterized protein n=1 Tax=Sphaerobolus stellatus (strain SS14) TaxID=990650 RepID=A0A0C9V507_SPHS4|nr:hypothetical protein M422DRAFT_265601 [Sphaerobolus stellatus SS14]
MLCQWAEAMVAYEKESSNDPDEEVTKSKPPHFRSFMQFHSEKSANMGPIKSPSPEPITNPTGLTALRIPPSAGTFPFSFFYPQLLPGYAPPPNAGFPFPQGMVPSANHANALPGISNPHQTPIDIPSSNGVPASGIPFPLIEDFFKDLESKPQAVQRNLEAFKDKFAEQNILFLDELKGLTMKGYTQEFSFVLVTLASWKVWWQRRFGVLKRPIILLTD